MNLRLIYILIPILFVLVSAPLAEAQTLDSIEISEQKFLDLVRADHPVMFRARILLDQGDANLTKARGDFDPEFYGDLGQKYYDDKQYYSLLNSGLKIPTWFGISLDAGLEDNRGTQLNPEGLTPDPELWNVGFSVPIGKGLFIDKRRANLRHAKIFVEQTQAERRLLLNQVLMEASEAYWQWYEAYFKVEVSKEALANAEERYLGVVISAQRGDKPAIDTLEAKIQVQSRQADLLEIELNYENKKLLLETFLWKEGVIPLELAENSIPERIDVSNQMNVNLLMRLDSLNGVHPKLISYRKDIEMQEVKVRLNRENIKPKIDLKYNALSAAQDRGDVINNFSMNDYNWGLKVSMPLFLRKERGTLKLSNLKLQDLQYKLKQEEANINYKARAAVNKVSFSADQLALFQETVENYRLLYEAELVLFNIGESSLFLVNSREISWLKARLKLVSLLSKNQIAQAELNFHLAMFE